MKKINAYKTWDGVVHESLSDAARHVDRQFGDLLTSLTHKALRQDKYKTMMDFLNNHLEEFATLKALKEDRTVQDCTD